MGFTFSFARWRTAALDAFAPFPFVLLCGAIGSACAITAIHAGSNENLRGNCARLAMSVALGLPLFFSLRILRERGPRLAHLPIEWLGLPLLAVWFFSQPSRPWDGPEISLQDFGFSAGRSSSSLGATPASAGIPISLGVIALLAAFGPCAAGAISKKRVSSIA